MTDEVSMSNHQDTAKAFLKTAGTGNVQEGYDRYVAPSFIHHNQYFKGDRQSLLTAMQEASKTSPNKSIDIKHVYEDGDTVITHSLVTRQDPHAQEIAVIHILSVRTRSHRGAVGCRAAHLEGFAEREWDVLTGGRDPRSAVVSCLWQTDRPGLGRRQPLRVAARATGPSTCCT